jgi:hypothetical protein
MNPDQLKKEARKVFWQHSNVERPRSLDEAIDLVVDKVTQAERERCTEIARDLDSCTGDGMTHEECHNTIATTIEKGDA